MLWSMHQESAVNTVSSGVGSVVTGIVADKELSGNGTNGSLLGLIKKGIGMIKDTKLASPMLSTMGAAVLSALNLCEELYRAKEQVNSYRVKEDLYTDSEMTQQKLDRALARIDEEESINAILQSKYDQMADELADTQDMLDEYKDKFTALRTEYELNKRTLTELQSKFLENQIELVKARKTLLDFDDDK